MVQALYLCENVQLILKTSYLITYKLLKNESKDKIII